jgi:putative tryptophan/tyrosine transport system substrate-binding protein
MRRREFITLLGGTAATWPIAVRGQQLAIPVVGFLNSGSSNSLFFANLVTAFRSGLKDAGYVEGQNVAIDFRWAEGQYDRLPALADVLVRRQVAVIDAGGPPAALAAKAATTTIPIVFTVDDNPVRYGLVAGLSRPGGNATGINLMIEELETKRLGLLRDVVPTAAIIAVLLNPKSPDFETQSRDLQAAARAVGLQIQILTADTEQDIDRAFATLGRMQAGALMIGADSFLQGRDEQLVALAARRSFPMMFASREAPEVGGLMSYGISIPSGYRQAGIYVGRILKGEKPADLPVVQSQKFDLVINLKTAKALGLTIPDKLIALADEVID